MLLRVCGKAVPFGNYSFVDDIKHRKNIYEKLFEAEKQILIDYADFARKIRMAFEAFALDEEAYRRQQISQYAGMDFIDIKDTIHSEIWQPASVVNCKTIIAGLCSGREQEFEQFLIRYGFLSGNNHSIADIRRKLKSYIKYVYDFGSASSHEPGKIDYSSVPNKNSSYRIATSFHDFLCVYYNVNKRFNQNMIPIGDYIPLPNEVVEHDIGLQLEPAKRLFVKSKKELIQYYIIGTRSSNISKTQKRDFNTINKLWEDNFDDPMNIIRQIETIQSAEKDTSYQVYSLPGKPLRLSRELMEAISNNDKKELMLGICKGVATIHAYDPPLYHRNICPDSFYIFQIKGHYKPLLSKFEYTKDTDSDITFTVYKAVEKKAENSKENTFFAPEVVNPMMRMNINWEKADIYSLAKTCLFIISKNDNIDDPLTNMDSYDWIDDEVLLVLGDMMNSDPQKRPPVNELLLALRKQ